MLDPIQRDIERLGRVFPGRLPALPLVPGNGRVAEEPRTPPEFFGRLPSEVSMTAQSGLDLLVKLPGKLVEDATTALNNLVRLPREVSQELFLTPGLLAQRLAPSNINNALATVRDSADFKGVTDPKQAREKMRTITDVIDLFTPT